MVAGKCHIILSDNTPPVLPRRGAGQGRGVLQEATPPLLTAVLTVRATAATSGTRRTSLTIFHHIYS